MDILGIDIGGSGIKGAPVDTKTGKLLAERHRIKTPKGAEPEPVAEVVGRLVQYFDWQGPVGVGFPAVVQYGEVKTAANISESWIGLNAREMFAAASGCDVTVINDADAAGLAEMKFGAGKGRRGTVLLLTLGTGIGSALFNDGVLIPNTEFGHMEIECEIAELRMSDAARQRDELSWKKWAKRLNRYIGKLHLLLQPNLIILGGGVSKEYEKFLPLLKVNCEIVPAQFFNEAGIVGAALAGAKKKK